MKLDTNTLRTFNTNLVRNALKNTGISTKNSLSTETGLSVGSCKTILDDLIELGEVIELELGAPKGGRPSRRFQYNFNYKFRLSIYFEVLNSKTMMFLYVHNLMDREITSISVEYISEDNMIRAIKSILHEYPNIDRCVISIPGVVQNGSILVCDIASLSGVNLKKVISQNTGLVTEVENDVNTMAFGSLADTALHDYESLVHLYFPDGNHPGMGIIMNNTVIRGINSFAGELNNLPMYEGLSATELREDTTRYEQYILDIVKTINAILNPDCISLTITNFDHKSLESKLRKIKLVGQIQFEDNIQTTTLNGLTYLHDKFERN